MYACMLHGLHIQIILCLAPVPHFLYIIVYCQQCHSIYYQRIWSSYHPQTVGCTMQLFPLITIHINAECKKHRRLLIGGLSVELLQELAVSLMTIMLGSLSTSLCCVIWEEGVAPSEQKCWFSPKVWYRWRDLQSMTLWVQPSICHLTPVKMENWLIDGLWLWTWPVFSLRLTSRSILCFIMSALYYPV